MEIDKDNEQALIEAKKKIYLYGVVENCIIYVIVFVGAAIYKIGWIWLLLLFCNSIKRNSK